MRSKSDCMIKILLTFKKIYACNLEKKIYILKIDICLSRDELPERQGYPYSIASHNHESTDFFFPPLEKPTEHSAFLPLKITSIHVGLINAT